MTDAPTDAPDDASIDGGAPPQQPPPTDNPAGDAPPPSGPPTAGPPTRPELRRSLDDKVLAGVAGGIARTLDVDAVLVRIGLVVLCLTFPPAFLAYLAAWFLLPVDGDQRARSHAGVAVREGGVLFWVVAIFLVGATILAGNDTLFRGFPLLPLVLIGVGVALWTREGSRAAVPGYTAPQTTAATRPGTSAWPAAPTAGDGDVTDATDVVESPYPQATYPQAAYPQPVWSPERGWQPAGGGSWSGPGGPAAAPYVPPKRPRRRRSPLGPIVLALALIAAGVTAALDAGGALSASPTEVAAVAMLVLGLGLLVGSVWGRAKWLTLVAMLLLPAVAFGSLVREVTAEFDIDSELTVADGLGERNIDVVGDEALPEHARLLAGSIDLDLRRWTPDATMLAGLDVAGPDVVVEVGAGEAIIRPPSDIAWRIVGQVGIGEIQVRNPDGSIDRTVSTENVGTSLDIVERGGPEGGPVLDIHVDVALGVIDVRPADPDALALSGGTTTITTLELP